MLNLRTGMKMKKHGLEKLAVLMTGVLCLVIIMNNNEFEDVEDVTSPSKDTYEIPYKHINLPKSATLQPSFPSCEQDVNAANVTGFSKLPHHVQDFLLYRHCREFPMLQEVPTKCGGPKNSADVFLLLVIKSSPENYDRRQVLRKTWAKEQQHKGLWMRRIFIIGTSGTGFDKQRLNKLVKLENDENQDILQWDFNDTFFNLTLKQILFLQWMDRWCPQARFLLNGDDDIFANTFNMVEYLQGQEGNDGSKHLFTGHLIQNVGPIRHPASKYYIPVQVQESERYPPYCGGGGFLLSGFTARTIYNMSHSITILPIDDVYMGMCLEKAGLHPESHFGVRTAGLYIPSQNVDTFHPCYYREIILVHRFLPHQIFVMWNEILDPNLKCGADFSL
ncbi:N-acetyllactosaminide beta-1,3-N-acetylglucosaminyltransferase 3-like [Xyrauchen texanus]|uniref:N-acetyllactosaminide beta-1,3-N-acetylglucosaminyltransferase 3-like n=1 Tax=Xyrauchen texanus TaxID=154827 RepID=UPI00224295B9|nr:N-acetyllactosaminide beta-1,3-N-acetylglucosaminyltransferase 3-like [Xyrauchen texanus]